MQRRQLHQSCVFLVSSAGETENNQVCCKAKHCPHLQKERVENGREWDGRKTQQQDAARKFELVSLEFEHFPPFPLPISKPAAMVWCWWSQGQWQEGHQLLVQWSCPKQRLQYVIMIIVIMVTKYMLLLMIKDSNTITRSSANSYLLSKDLR